MLVVGDFFEICALVNALVGTFGDGELGGDAPEITGLKVSDLEFAREDDRERGRLDAADGGDIAGAGAEHTLGEGAGPVDADEPIALGAAAGGVGEAGHLRAFAEILEGGIDAFGGHGLHPRALEGNFALRKLVDVSENQLTLAAGVAGIDEQSDIFSGEKFLEM